MVWLKTVDGNRICLHTFILFLFVKSSHLNPSTIKKHLVLHDTVCSMLGWEKAEMKREC